MKRSYLRTLFIPILSLALIVSVVLNLVFFQYGRHYYLLLNATRLDPLGLSNYPRGPDVGESFSNGMIRVVFLGDSRAAMWPTPIASEYQFFNRGLGSQTSMQVLGRFDEHVLLLNPDVVILQLGVNDLKTIPLFPNEKDEIIRNCKTNIDAIINLAVREDATVIVTTIFPLGSIPIERRLFWSDDVAQGIDEVNDYISSLQSDHVIVLNTAHVLANENGIVRSEYSLDFLHINEAGYQALNEELLKVLKYTH